MRYLGSLYVAVAVLVLTFALGTYVNVRSEHMHAQQLGISTRLERIVRLEQELAGLLSGAVLEQKLLRANRYESVDASLKDTVARVAELSREMQLSEDISVLLDQQAGLRATEARSLAHMRSGRWRQARAVLFEEDYLLAKKVYEITTESVVGALTDELTARARRLRIMRAIADGLRVGALLLLLWVGVMFARRLRLELAEQDRLQREIRAANEHLEEGVRQRTAELEAANRQLAALSTTDGLTGLANRRHFDEVWQGEWQRAARVSGPLALVLIDVDNFKAYNDHYGHQAGDDCLRRVAAVLAREARRAGELVARYGGEEFVVVLPGTSAADAQLTAERIRAAVQAEAMAHALTGAGVVTISLGLALGRPQHLDDAELLLKGADVALYTAKQNGRNRVVVAG